MIESKRFAKTNTGEIVAIKREGILITTFTKCEMNIICNELKNHQTGILNVIKNHDLMKETTTTDTKRIFNLIIDKLVEIEHEVFAPRSVSITIVSEFFFLDNPYISHRIMCLHNDTEKEYIQTV